MTATELLQRARQALADGAYRTAQALFARVVAQDPRSAEAYFGLALACAKLGDYQSAADHFRACTELDPRQAAAHINLGVAYVLLGKPDDAIPALRKGLQLAPQSPHAYYNLGLAYRAKGILDLAAEAFREAIRKDPKLVPAYLNLGNVLFDLARFREAATAYAEGLRVDPTNESLRQGQQACERAMAAESSTEEAATAAGSGQPAAEPAGEAVRPFATVAERAEALVQTYELSIAQEKAVEDMLKVIDDVVQPAIRALSHTLVHSGAGRTELELRVREYRDAMERIAEAEQKLAKGVLDLCRLGKRFSLSRPR